MPPNAMLTAGPAMAMTPSAMGRGASLPIWAMPPRKKSVMLVTGNAVAPGCRYAVAKLVG